VEAGGAGRGLAVGAGLSLRQRLRVDDAAAPGTVLARAGLAAEVLTGCDADPARAAAEPGRVWRSGPAPGAQSPTASPVRLWVNPPDCPPPPATTPRRRWDRAATRAAEPSRQVAATFFCRTVSSTLCACWSTKRVNSCWA
jgi:hypothetical protein